MMNALLARSTGVDLVLPQAVYLYYVDTFTLAIVQNIFIHDFNFLMMDESH